MRLLGGIMNSIKFLYRDRCGIDEQLLAHLLTKLEPEITRIVDSRTSGYESQYAMVNVPFDVQRLKKIKAIIHAKKELNPSMLIVIGIGGSNLGTMAAAQGLQVHGQGIPLYYADTIDPDMLAPLLELTETTLKKGHQVLINIVSKSGKTAETLINASFFIELLTRYRPRDYANYVVVTTEKGDELWDLATMHNFTAIDVPKNIGGRFSVLTGVGLFPLGFADIDVDQLVVGAQQMTENCLSKGISNYAAVSAAILFDAYRKGFVIHDFFPFSVDMKSLGLWYRQLIAESLGKEFAIDGTKVNVGITPTVSIGSTDLHSMVQLHLGGPANTITTFLGIEKWRHDLKIPEESIVSSLIDYAKGKKTSTIMNAILEGITRTYHERKLPFMHLMFPEKNAFYYGQFFQWKILEIIYLGHFFNINPFDQPLVESYKNETRVILSNE